MTYIEKEFKSILNVRKHINHWFWDKYSINPYNGCHFSCIYCDSRSEKYYLPKDFEREIVVKANAGEMLDKRLSRARNFLPDVVALGGTTDPYQPVEAEHMNSQQCLKVLARHQYPVHICTKSPLVLRDLDIIHQIAEQNWAAVSVTITTVDDKKASFLEPQAPRPKNRLRIIREIKNRTPSVQAGVLLMPVVPHITDDPQELELVVAEAKESGADYILFGAGMTMRDAQALYFLKHLRASYPELIPQYEAHFRFKDDSEVYSGSYEGNYAYYKYLNDLFYRLCGKYRMPYCIKRYIPDDFRKDNYTISEKLFYYARRLELTGQQWKTVFLVAQYIQELKEPVRDKACRQELGKIRGITPKMQVYIESQLEIASN